MAQDRFLEFTARWGGLTTRVVNKEGEIELRTVYSMAEEILKAKIDKEAREVESNVREWKDGFYATHQRLTPQEFQTAADEQRKCLTETYPQETQQ